MESLKASIKAAVAFAAKYFNWKHALVGAGVLAVEYVINYFFQTTGGMLMAATAYINQERFGVEFEDRVNKLINVDPKDTPFMSMVQKSEAYRNRVDWQTETFAAADANNAAVEGANVTFAAGDYVAPVGVFNYTQIPQRPFAASFSLDAMRKPGIGSGDRSTFTHEKMKKLIEMKRDAEASLVSNNQRQQPLPETSQAGLLRGVQRWITTNIVNANDKGFGGNIFSQKMFNAMAQKAVDQGSAPDTVFCNSFNRIKINEFVSRPTRDVDSLGRKIVDMVDTIISIAGTQTIVFNRHLTASVVLMLEMKYWEQRILRAPQSYIAGLLGSRTEGWVEIEHTLISWAEKASAICTNTKTA